MGQSGQEQTVSTEIDPDIKERQLGLFDRARQHFQQSPLQPFGGPRVAGFSPLQEQAQSLAGTMATDPSLAGVEQAQQAAGVAGGIAGGGGLMSGLQQFQNPFTDQVVDRSLQDLNRSRQMALGDVSSNATTSGAFGGSRHGVAEAETNRAFADQAARTSAQLRSQGFDRAADLAGQDINQRLRGSALLSGFGGDVFSRAGGTAGLLGQFGGQQQALEQAQLDADRQRHLEGQNLPMQQFGFLQSMLSGAPVGQTQTSNVPGTRGADVAGGVLTGAGTGAAVGSVVPGLGTAIGAGIGAGIGGLGGWLG